MKYKILLFVLVAGFTLGCSDLGDLNVDKKNPAISESLRFFAPQRANSPSFFLSAIE